MPNGMNEVTEAVAQGVTANHECGENAPTDQRWCSGRNSAEKTTGEWKS